MVRQFIPWNQAGGQILDIVRREMEDLAGRLQDEDGETTSFAPRSNVVETENSFELTLDLPGMKAEDFNIEMHEGRLTVSGERNVEIEAEGATFHRIERQSGTFHRSFKLNQEVDADDISADYESGVLRLQVPKVVKAQPTKIKVQSND